MDWLISSCLPTHTLLKNFVSSLFCSMVNVRVRMSLMVLCTWSLCELRRVFAFAIEHREFSPEFISIVHTRFGSGFHHHTFFDIIIGILSVAHPFNYSTSLRTYSSTLHKILYPTLQSHLMSLPTATTALCLLMRKHRFRLLCFAKESTVS